MKPLMNSPDGLAQSADKAAIGLSFFCVLHCLLLPFTIVLIPSASILGMEDELFHRLLLIIVIPVSAYALLSGLRNHKNKTVLAAGVSGLLVLILGAMIGHDTFGETGERIITVLGSFLVAFGHFKNFQLGHLRKIDTDPS